MKDKICKSMAPFFYALPSVAVGMWVMYTHDISAAIYMQNFVFLMLCNVISTVYISWTYDLKIGEIGTIVIAIASVLFLAGSFLSDGIDDVHRWIQIGPMNLNIAFIALPILLITINRLLEKGRFKICIALILVSAILLFLQPDASMISAFSVALLPIIYTKCKNKLWNFVVVAILIFFSAISWSNIDRLQPVSYVENIIVLAKESGWVYLFLCIFALFVMIWPFVRPTGFQQCRGISVSLGLFFFVLIMSTLFGNFPVPLIGYGISPILGYMISAAYVVKKKSYL